MTSIFSPSWVHISLHFDCVAPPIRRWGLFFHLLKAELAMCLTLANRRRQRDVPVLRLRLKKQNMPLPSLGNTAGLLARTSPSEPVG